MEDYVWNKWQKVFSVSGGASLPQQKIVKEHHIEYLNPQLVLNDNTSLSSMKYYDEKLYVFGYGFFEDTDADKGASILVLDLKEKQSKVLVVKTPPSPVMLGFGSAFTVHNGRIFVFSYGKLCSLSLSDFTWESHTDSTRVPPGRAEVDIIGHGDSIYIFGGRFSDDWGFFTDYLVYSLSNKEFGIHPYPVEASFAYTTVSHGPNIYIYGGGYMEDNEDECCNEIKCFNTNTKKFTTPFPNTHDIDGTFDDEDDSAEPRGSFTCAATISTDPTTKKPLLFAMSQGNGKTCHVFDLESNEWIEKATLDIADIPSQANMLMATSENEFFSFGGVYWENGTTKKLVTDVYRLEIYPKYAQDLSSSLLSNKVSKDMTFSFSS